MNQATQSGKPTEKEKSDINDLIRIINNPQHETDVELLVPYPAGPDANDEKDDDQGSNL